MLGGSLLLLSVPRLVAALHLLAGDPGVALLHAGQLPSPAAFRRIVASRQSAAWWVSEPATFADLGLAYLSLAQTSAPGTGQRGPLLDLATRHLQSSLSLAPADPYAWTYLAFVHTATGDHARAAGALELSLRTGPYQPDLVLSRAALGLANWPWLAHATAGRLEVEFAHALRQAPDRFVADVVDSGRTAEVRARLAAQPDLARALERRLEELGRHAPSGSPAS